MQHLNVQQTYEYEPPSRQEPGWEQYPSPQIDMYEPIAHPYPPSKRHSGLAYDEPTEEPSPGYSRSRHDNGQSPSHQRF